MKKAQRFLACVLILAFTFVSCSNDNGVEEIEGINLRTYVHSSVEVQLLDLVNAHRVNQGLNALQIIEHISFTSSEHNAYMIAVNQANHDNFSSRKEHLERVLAATRVGENVAYGFSSPQATLNAWIASEAHNVNLMGNYTHFRLSIKENENGRRYYTAIFIRK
jgi:uncharacterized protein YkwD